MKIFTETDRLILREIVPEDANAMFEMDSDPEVHTYLGGNQVTSMDQINEAIQFIRKQYIDVGIGRWAVIEKKSQSFIGWSGLKLVPYPINQHTNFYDLGYRFIRRYWGLGYATEAANASLHFGFEKMNLSDIYAMTEAGNVSSANVLNKVGMRSIGTFDYEQKTHFWYHQTSAEWLARMNQENDIR